MKTPIVRVPLKARSFKGEIELSVEEACGLRELLDDRITEALSPRPPPMDRERLVPWVNKYGIVVFDLNGGDAAYHFVDQERWEQVVAVHNAGDDGASGWADQACEVAGWLTSDGSPETDRPEGAPDRKGALLKTCFTQTFVVEQVGLQGELLGILTFP